MRSQRLSAFTLVEVIVGIGLAGALVLLVLLVGATALRTDAKASDQQIAAAVAESQLDVLSRAIMVPGSSARISFWSAGEGSYSAPPVTASVFSNGTEYYLKYTLQNLPSKSGGTLSSVGNRLRQVQLQVTWGNGEQGTPGFGQFSILRTRVLRESHVLP